MFTLQDIKLMEEIIRACQLRGAFQVNEASVIAPLYKKITDIIKENSPEEKEEKEDSLDGPKGSTGPNGVQT